MDHLDHVMQKLDTPGSWTWGSASGWTKVDAGKRLVLVAIGPAVGVALVGSVLELQDLLSRLVAKAPAKSWACKLIGPDALVKTALAELAKLHVAVAAERTIDHGSIIAFVRSR